MKPTSIDLRERIVAARAQDGQSMGQIALRFKIPKGAVQNILERYRDSGGVQPKPPNSGRKSAFSGAALDRLEQDVRLRPNAPLAIVVSGANSHDSVKLEALLEAKGVEPKEEQVQNLCLDAGYVPHIRPRGEGKKQKAADPSFKPRRWIVELGHSWFNRFRKLSPRHEKTAHAYLGLVMLAAAMIVLNKVMAIYG